MKLRTYQKEAVEAVYRNLRERDGNPCVVIPTGGGKTWVIAQLCKDAVGRWNGRVLILAHVKELLEQAKEKLEAMCPEIDAGIYSAGLKRRDTDHPVIIAGIQSVYRRARDLGSFDLVVIDEAHRIPADGDGMYRTFLEEAQVVNPSLRVIGLTATPYRLDSGLLCGPGNVLSHVCYEVGVKELIVQGCLCPLITKAGREEIDTAALHVRAGEFVGSEMEALMDTEERVEAACREILEHARDRQSILIFAAGIQHGKHLAQLLRERIDADVGTVFGETFSFERASTVEAFKEGSLRFLVNVNVLTLGFDAPNIDCVALLRPTASPGLYYQMVGRGFRLCEGKENCLILDFGGNVVRHGPVDAVRVAEPDDRGTGKSVVRVCPSCQSVIAAGCAACPDCGHEFPDPNRQDHEPEASTEGVLSWQSTSTEYQVSDVRYTVHCKRSAPEDAPKTMRVEYRVSFNRYYSEWICFEHSDYPRKMAEWWWRNRSDAPIPDTAEQAVDRAQEGAVAETDSITVQISDWAEYPSIVGYGFGAKPSWREPGWDEESAEPSEHAAEENHEVPF